MGIVFATATLAPDYEIRLILIGSVKIKWIAAVLFIIDVINTAGSGNEGGHFAHIGGAVFGYLYITQLRNGNDMTGWLQKLLDRDQPRQQAKPTTTKRTTRPRKKAPMKVAHRQSDTQQGSATPNQEKLDAILDKIKASGYDSLSQSEKDYLNLMSNS